MIRLPNIDKNFPRIEQVIDRNGVKPGFELFEEEELNEEQENLGVASDKSSAQQEESMPPRAEVALRHEPEPDEQGDRLHESDKHVPVKSAPKGQHYVSQRQLGGFEGKEQDQPQRKPAEHQRQKIQGSEPVAGVGI